MIYEKYGQCYDLIYSGKDYECECQSLIEYFKRFSKRHVKIILDVGQGIMQFI